MSDVVGYLGMTMLQIYRWVCQRKNLENLLTFREVMDKSLESFCWLMVYILHIEYYCKQRRIVIHDDILHPPLQSADPSVLPAAESASLNTYLWRTDGTTPGPILSVFPALIVHSELKSVHPGFPVAFIF